MDAPARVVHPLLILALIAVAVAGYLAGSRRSDGSTVAADPPSVSRSLNHAGLLLEYPADWRRVRPPEVPGLALAEAVALAPAKHVEGELLTGQLPGALPASFLVRLRRLPHVEVVNLVSTQAYRYSELQVSGYSGSLDLYAIPAVGGGDRMIACLGGRRLAPAVQECERIVSGIAVTGPPTATLTPEPLYAKSLAEILSTLSAERLRARATMSRATAPAVLGAAASGLAGRLSSSSAALSALHAPPAAQAAGAALAGSVRTAARAYLRLAAASRAEDLAAYREARAAVAPAESSIDEALRGLVLLGYG